MTPKLVATDLDGTIIGVDETISPRTRAALALVERAGAVLVLVTGRPPRWMHTVAEQTGHRGIAVCANGALIYDLHDESVLESQLLEPESLREVCSVVRAILPGADFAVERGRQFIHEPSYATRWDSGMPWVRTGSYEEILSEPAAKLLIHVDGAAADELLGKIVEVAGGLAEFTHSSRFGLVEVSARGVSKATGLAHVAEMHGIAAADVLAFGDMPNDLPMLTWAGTAYAMRNAHPTVLAAIDRVAPPVDEDGVAQILEPLFRPPGKDEGSPPPVGS
jgi:Cof subfamily protein (haloacid dehalogenase superfamily)